MTLSNDEKYLLYRRKREMRKTSSEIQDLQLKISSNKIKYVLWSTSAVILILFLAKRMKMIN